MLVEHFNGTLKAMLRKVSIKEPKEWDRCIPSLLFTYRELLNETLGFSPFELVYSHSPRGLLDLLADKWVGHSEQDSDKNVYQYVHDLHNRVKDTRELTQQTAKMNTEVYKQYADRKAKARTLTPGSRVLVLLTDEHNKLQVLLKGPYEMTKKVNYQIQMNGREKVFHINMLKEYTKWTNIAINQLVPSSVSPTLPTHTSGTTPPDFVFGILDSELFPDVSSRARNKPVISDNHTQTTAVGLVSDTDVGSEEAKPLPTLSYKGETWKDVVMEDTLSEKRKFAHCYVSFQTNSQTIPVNTNIFADLFLVNEWTQLMVVSIVMLHAHGIIFLYFVHVFCLMYFTSHECL